MAYILIVEDSPTQAERLRLILEAEGFDVEGATTAEEALALAERKKYDLVISDVVMPGQSGYELCRKIKQLPISRRTPVILLTTLDNPMAIIEGLDSGADNFLTKPYQAEELLHRIHKLLETKALRQDGKVKLGVDVAFLGKRFTITSDKEQIVDLLISTFEDVVRANAELQENRAALAAARSAWRCAPPSCRTRMRS
jgi:DNA-binding response OmpR family regulator